MNSWREFTFTVTRRRKREIARSVISRSLRDAGYEVITLGPKAKGYRRTYEFLEGIHIYRHPTAKEGNSPLGYVSILARCGIRGDHSRPESERISKDV